MLSHGWQNVNIRAGFTRKRLFCDLYRIVELQYVGAIQEIREIVSDHLSPEICNANGMLVNEFDDLLVAGAVWHSHL